MLVLHHMGLSYIIPRSSYYRGRLKTTDFEKTVMFEEATISENADLSKDKKNIYRYHKLSKEDKKSLYAARPDLDPKLTTTRAAPPPVTVGGVGDGGLRDPLLGTKKRGGLKKSSTTFAQPAPDAGSGAGEFEDEGHNSDSSHHSLSVLSGLVGVPDSMERLSYEASLAEALSPFHSGSNASTSLGSSNSGAATPYKHASPSTSVPRDSSEITMTNVDGLRLSVLSNTNDSSTSSEDNRLSSTEVPVPLEERGTTASLLVHTSSQSSAGGSGSYSAANEDDGAGGYDDGQDTDESSDDESDEEDALLNEPVN